MPKIRCLKPDFFLDTNITELTPLHRLAFEGLWLYADREGRLEDDPKRLKVQILPYDRVDMNAILQQLHPRFIIRYQVKVKKYIQIRNFLKHQRPHPHEPKSVIPQCNDKKLIEMSISTKVMTGTLDKDGTDTDGIDTDDISADQPRTKSPFHLFMDRFLAEMLELSPNGDPQKNVSINAAYRRFGKAGRDILAMAEGNPEVAFQGVRAVGLWLQECGLSWTLDTAAKHFLDWKVNPEGFHAKSKKN